MSKAQRKTKAIKPGREHRLITKDEVARRAYELFIARGQGEGQEVEDWLEAERQLEAESMDFQLKEGVQAGFQTVRTS